MAITQSEAAKLIAVMEETVRGAAQERGAPGLLELIDQWRSDVEAGRPVERKLKVLQSPGLDVLAETPRSRTTASGDFIGREDFTSVEQLDMLITALGLTFLAPQMMATRFLDTITAYRSEQDAPASAPAIHMTSDIGDEAEEGGPIISSATNAQSQQQTRALGILLDEIAKTAGFEQRNLTDQRKATDATSS